MHPNAPPALLTSSRESVEATLEAWADVEGSGVTVAALRTERWPGAPLHHPYERAAPWRVPVVLPCYCNTCDRH